jgi:hypothetical protein
MPRLAVWRWTGFASAFSTATPVMAARYCASRSASVIGT